MKKIFFFIAALCCAMMASATEGALPGKFTINANGDQVVFSQGNLRATTTDLGENWTWSFAEHQWDYVWGANNKINGNGTVSTNGIISLFGWSTAATYYGIYDSKTASDYSGDFVDWGTNAISNGGNAANLWRTLTADEWRYLLHERTNADELIGMGRVDGGGGVIILPDDWTLPDGMIFNTAKDSNLVWKPSIERYSSGGSTCWTHNSYTAEQWAVMEAAGAVFLCAEGYRDGLNMMGGMYPYWSSSLKTEERAYNMNFGATSIIPQWDSPLYYGCPVRLVQDYEEALPTYYVAGNGGSGNPWCDGLYWSPNGSAMTNGTITYHDVPAGTYEFKITDGQWGTGHEWAYGAVDATCCSANVQNGGTGSDGNIKLITSITQDITITFDGTNICVTGTFDDPNSVEITSYTIVGDSRVFESGWDVADTNNDMTETTTGVWTLTKNDVILVANVNYEYKMVGNHSYSVFQLPAGNNNNSLTVTESSNYDIVFTYDRSANTLTHVASKLTGVENTRADEIQSQKIIRDGQLLIIRNGKTYTVTGQETIVP